MRAGQREATISILPLSYCRIKEKRTKWSILHSLETEACEVSRYVQNRQWVAARVRGMGDASYNQNEQNIDRSGFGQ